jgi:hypothetical protein
MSSNFLSLGPSWKPMFKFNVISVCLAILMSLSVAVVSCLHPISFQFFLNGMMFIGAFF